MNEFVELIESQSQRYGSREAIRYQTYEEHPQWKSLSWEELASLVDKASLALCAQGVTHETKVALFTQNCPEVLIVHYGAFYNRAVPVPIYATSSAEEATHIINDSGATILFTGDQHQYETAQGIASQCPTLKLIVALDPRVKLSSEGLASVMWDDFLNQPGNNIE